VFWDIRAPHTDSGLREEALVLVSKNKDGKGCGVLKGGRREVFLEILLMFEMVVLL